MTPRPAIVGDGVARGVFQALKLEPWVVRCELSDSEWAAIKPFLPNKSHGIRRVNNRAYSMASFGSCVQVHHAAMCRFPMAHARPATTVSSSGERPEYGAGSWTHLPRGRSNRWTQSSQNHPESMGTVRHPRAGGQHARMVVLCN